MDASQFRNTLKVMMEMGQAIVDNYKSALGGSGSLANSLAYSVNMNGDEWAIVLNLESYWRWVGNGRGPGKMPPVDEIRKWIDARHILPRPMTLKTGKTIIPTVKSLAYLIARSIGRYGTHAYRNGGKNTLYATVEECQEYYKDRLYDAVQQDISDILHERYPNTYGLR